LLTFLAVEAWADAPKTTFKWRQAMTLLKIEGKTSKIADHSIGSAHIAGMAFFEDGKMAMVESVVAFDYLRGVGGHSGYMNYTFDNGVTFTLRFSGKNAQQQKGNISTEDTGEVEVVRASGPLAQIPGFDKATGSMEGKRFNFPNSAVVGYQDITLKLAP
jgi:hypothetical protein